nr:PREDICTED: U6 snRNA-associated Sm-like protein LSm1 [Apteryx mantelli mantelli]
MHSAGTPLRSADLAAATATIRLTLATSALDTRHRLAPPAAAKARGGSSPGLRKARAGFAGSARPCSGLENKKHLVLLRDGRTLIGYLRSIDQFANLVLHQTVERIHVGKKYGDIPRGIFVVRGENVVLLGEIDLEKESDTPLQQVSIEEILEEQRVEQQAKQESEKLKVQALKERGLSVPRADTLDEY